MLLQTSKLLTKILLLTALFYAVNGTDYLPNGDMCGDWHYDKNMDFNAASASNNIAHVAGPYSVGQGHNSCVDKCDSLSYGGASLLAASYKVTNYYCYCYFYDQWNGVDFTPDGVIPLVDHSEWETYFYCHDEDQFVANNRKCWADAGVAYDLSYSQCNEACLEHQECRAWSIRSENGECRLCSSLTNSVYHSGHSLFKLSTAPTCGAGPGNDANGWWKGFETGYQYQSGHVALYQDKIKHQCSSGFHSASGGTDAFQCNEFGQWTVFSGSQNPTCVMNDCSVPADQHYGVEGSCIGGTMSVGEVCEVTCGDGFASQSGTLTCTHTGNTAVIESTLECLPVCEIEYLPPGIVPSSDGCEVGDVQASCNVQCAEGYVPSTGTAVCTSVDGFSGLEWDIECYEIPPVVYPEEVEIYAFQFSYFCAQLLELTSAEDALSEYKANFPPNANCPTGGNTDACADDFWFEGIYCGDSLNYQEATPLADFVVSDLAEKEYSVVGFGFCRACDDSPHCKVNGYFTDDMSDELCRAQCDADTSCIGYSYAKETYGDSPNRCYVHSNYHDFVVPSDWNDFKQLQYSIQTTTDTSNQQDEVTCYEVVPAQQVILVFAGEDSYSQALYNAQTCDGGDYFDLSFDGPCDAPQYMLLDSSQEEQNWSEGFTSMLGEPCMTSDYDVATADHISNVGSHVTDEAYLNLHVSFPHYLEDVVLRWDSADGTVTHQPGEASDWELDNTQCSFQLETSISYTDLNNVAVVSVDDAELSFSMHVKGTETYTEQAGYTATREVTKTLTFTLSLATSVELELDLSILSHYEAIYALDTTQLFSELGLTTEEAIAQAAALLEEYNVAVLDVQANTDLGTFRRRLAADEEATTTVVIAGDQEDVDAAMQALLNGDVVLDFLEGAEFTGEFTDYTQLVSVITGYAGVTNDDGTSTGTIHFKTTINEPWELNGAYSLVDFDGDIHSLEEVPEGNSCDNYQGEETICEQEWILTVTILADSVCETDLQEFTIVMESAHGDEVMEEAPISITFHVSPNADQCQESVDLGDTSALIQGEIQVLNPNSGVYEDVPSWDIWLGDTITVEATFSTEIGVLTTASLTNMQATQEEEVCSDCFTQFEDELNFFCESCPEDVAYTHFNDGNSIIFSFRLSSSVFTGAGDGEPVSFVFSFEMSYEEGEQRRRLLKLAAPPRRQLEATQTDGSGSLNLNLFGNDEEIAGISTQGDGSVSESEEKIDAVTDRYTLAMVCLLAVVVALLVILIVVVLVWTCKPLSNDSKRSGEKSKAWE